jgi:imidazolonepropionase-like amidohydrolase
VGLFEVGMEDGYVDINAAGLMNPGFRAVDGYNPLSFHVGIDREEGVTTAVLTPTSGQLIAGQAAPVELAVADAAALAPPAKPVAMVGAFDGHVAERHGGARGALLLALRGLVDDVRFYRQNRAAYDRAQTRELPLARAHLEAMLPVVDGTLPLIVQADRAADIAALLDFAEAEKLKLVIASGRESWLLADRLKARGVPVIVTPSSAGQRSFDAQHARDDLATVLHRAGVEVILSSWETDNGTTRLRQEAGLAVQNGLPRDVALAAITSVPAKRFKLQHDGRDVGVLKAGARANLVLWSGDPLETTTVAERLWVAGRAPPPSRQRQLADKYLRPIVRAAESR